MINYTVVWETTHWSNVFLNCISFSCCVISNSSNCTSTKTIDLFVNFGTRVVALLTSTGNCPLNSCWMPSSNTSNLSKTSVSLSSQLFGTKSLDDTLSSFTFSNTNGINTLVAFENFTNGNLLFKLGPGPFNFLLNITTINLNFHNLGLVLSLLDLANLSGCKHTDNGAVLLYTSKISLN